MENPTGPDVLVTVTQMVPSMRDRIRILFVPDGTVCKFQPYLMMRTADGSFVPWLASQTDLLATDWEVVTNPAAPTP